MPSNVSGSVVKVLSQTVTLTNAQVKALPGGVLTEGFTQLVEAPGSGRAYRLLAMQLVSDFVGGAYGNISADAQMLGAVGEGIASYSDQTLVIRNVSGGNSPITAMFGEASSRLIYAPAGFLLQDIGGAVWVANVNASLVSLIENRPIGLYCYNALGDFNGGNAANALKATVLYTVIDV
jgi:hypothetical protein